MKKIIKEAIQEKVLNKFKEFLEKRLKVEHVVSHQDIQTEVEFLLKFTVEDIRYRETRLTGKLEMMTFSRFTDDSYLGIEHEVDGDDGSWHVEMDKLSPSEYYHNYAISPHDNTLRRVLDTVLTPIIKDAGEYFGIDIYDMEHKMIFD